MSLDVYVGIDLPLNTFRKARVIANAQQEQAEDKLRQVTDGHPPASDPGRACIERYVEGLAAVPLLRPDDYQSLRNLWSCIPSGQFDETPLARAVDMFVRKEMEARKPNERVTKRQIKEILRGIRDRLDENYATFEAYYAPTPNELDAKRDFLNIAVKDNFAPIGSFSPRTDQEIALRDPVTNNIVGIIDFAVYAKSSTVQTNFPLVPAPYQGTALGEAIIDRLLFEQGSFAADFIHRENPEVLQRHGGMYVFVETDFVGDMKATTYMGHLATSAGRPEWTGQWLNRGFGWVDIDHAWPVLSRGGKSVRYDMHVAFRRASSDGKLGDILRLQNIDPQIVLDHYTACFTTSTVGGGLDDSARRQLGLYQAAVVRGDMLRIHPETEHREKLQIWETFFNAVEEMFPDRHLVRPAMLQLGTNLPQAAAFRASFGDRLQPLPN